METNGLCPESCPIYIDPFSPHHASVPLSLFIPLSSLDSTCHAFPAWFSWSQLGGGSNRGGWERLTGEGRRRPWQVRCFPRAPDSSPPPVDSGKPPEDPALLLLQMTSQGPWGGTQACEDDISRDTGRRWPTELRGSPRTGLSWRVWVHIKGTRGFLCSGDP